jgi:CHAT domain-containing protein/Flp pilus assembly protein TadD
MLIRLLVLLLFFFSTPALAETPAWLTLTKEAYRLHQAGEPEQAITIGEKSIEFATQIGDPLAVATATNTLGLIYLELEDFFNADKRFEISAGLYEGDPRMGPDAENTAKAYKNWALSLQQLGRNEEAESRFRNSLRIYEQFDANRHHPFTLDIVKGLANTLVSQARYQEARELYQEVVEKSEKDSLAAQQASQGLANIMSTLGKYDEAEATLLPIVTYYQDTDTPSTQSYERLAEVLGTLGGVKGEQGDFRTAEEHFKRALRLKRRTSPNRPSLAWAMTDLALLYSEIGDLQKAEPLLREALAIHENTMGAEHPLTSTSLNNLALLLLDKGEYERAEELLNRSLEIDRQVYHDKHPRVGRALLNLGALHLSAEKPEEALPLLEQAADLFKVKGGPDYATALTNLGSAYHYLEKLEQAEQAFQTVLEIGAPDEVLTAHNNLAYLLIDRGQPKSALVHAQTASEVLFKRLQNVFSFTSERQRLDFKRKLIPYGLLVTLDSPHDTFQTALRFKGAVLDSIIEDKRLARAAQDPKLQEILDAVEVNKRELMQLELENAETERATSLREAVEDGEATLARELAGFTEKRTLYTVTPKQVQEKLPSDTVLVEFLHHGYYLGKSDSEKRYSALVVPPEGEIRLVPLGTAEEITKRIGDYREQVLGARSATRASRVLLKTSQAGKDPAALSALYDLIWKPIEEAIPPGVNSILLSPDGELNFVSFATLLDSKGDFLAERYEISYLSSGRDLITSREKSDSDTSVVSLFGNPEYGEHDPEVKGVVLSPLPGTETECLTLKGVLKKRTPALDMGQDAKESTVRTVSAPHILHIATHGLFLSEELGPRNPMSRSGLAFAGAQTTLDDWALGHAPEPDQDGLLTAEEVGGMDLSSTELVVLSACDTGLGATENGEGVLGLRRGFVKSGAHNLMFTLWPIDDAETARFMVDFYGRLGSDSPRQALSQTQREWLVRLKESEGAVTAARLAGPFVLSSVGSP